MNAGRILVVDDEQSARIVLKKVLSRDGYEVNTVENGEDGLKAISVSRPDLVLMDIIMPDYNGRDVIAQMKQREGENMPPYIYLTVDPTHEREGLEEGVDDYIYKGDMNPDKLQIIRLRVKNTMLVRSLLYKDGLTGLYNHGFFQNALKRIHAEATAQDDPLSLIIGDIDEFKTLNDVYGHSYGDRLLAEIANVFRASARQSDVVARYGGEEFAVIAPRTSCSEAMEIAEELRRGLSDLSFTGQQGPVTMSFGIAAAPAEGCEDDADILRSAEDRMYLAKRSGKNRVVGD